MSSEDMVERVARALAASDPEYDPEWDYTDQARAAIGAMREPTDRIGNGLPKGYKPGSHSAADIWRSLIDAALSPNHTPHPS